MGLIKCSSVYDHSVFVLSLIHSLVRSRRTRARKEENVDEGCDLNEIWPSVVRQRRGEVPPSNQTRWSETTNVARTNWMSTRTPLRLRITSNERRLNKIRSLGVRNVHTRHTSTMYDTLVPSWTDVDTKREY